MKKRVVYKFTAFDERIKQIAKEVAREFPGVTKVVDVKGELGQLEVRGDFSTFGLTNELKKIDKYVESIKIGPDGVTEQEVKKREEGKRPINIKEPSKLPNDVASSSTWTGFWDQAKGMGAAAAGQAKGVGAAAAEKAKAIGAVAIGYLENRKLLEEERLGNEKWEEERMKRKKIWEERNMILQEKEEELEKQMIWEERYRILQEKEEEMRQKKIRESNDRIFQEKEEEMRLKKMKEDNNRILQDKEKVIKQIIAMKDKGKKQKKIWQDVDRILQEKEKMREEQSLAKKSEGDTTQGSTATGNTSASRQDQDSAQTGKNESQPGEKKGKKGK